MTINIYATRLVASAGLMLLYVGGLPALADDETTKLDEIVVTAQKREENLQDVGISVTAFSAKQLAQLGMVSTTDLTNQVPNFRFVQSSPGTVNLNIRGVSQNDFADHLEGPIAVYLDDSYQGLSTAIGGQMFDLERVEVLRGPQGTLFGRNATGGLVQYISKQPSADFEAYAQATLGRFNERILEAAVGGPLTDAVRVRFSMASNYNDPWGINSAGGPDTGVVDNWSMRFQAVADLNSATQLHFTVRGGGNGREDEGVTGTVPAYSPPGVQGLGQYVPANLNVYGTCAGCNLFGNTGNHYDRSDGTMGTPGRVVRDNVGATLKLTSDLGPVQLTAITDGMYIRKETDDFDTDNNLVPLFNYTAQTKYHQYSQEVRLNGTVGALKWIGGLYYLNMDGHYHVQVDFDPSFTAGLPDGTLATSSKNFYQITTKSWSAFSQGDYAITDTLNATLGVRFTSDKKQDDFVWSGNYPGAGPAFSFVYNPSTDSSAERTFNMVSAKAALDWHFAPDKLLYASFSRGMKGGNWESPVFPGPTPTVAQALPHNPETLYDYEVGVKTMWLQDRLRFNAGLFYYDYKNYQAFGLVNLVQSIENDDATEVGGEMELTYLPVQGLSLSLGLAALDSKVKNHTMPDGVTKENVQLPLAPKFSGNAAARYEHPLFGGTGAVGANFNYTGHQYFDVNNGPLTEQAGHGLTDLRTSWETADHRWEMALWVKNVTNKTYTVFQQDIAALSLGNYLLAPPRWYGVTMRVSY